MKRKLTWERINLEYWRRFQTWKITAGERQFWARAERRWYNAGHGRKYHIYDLHVVEIRTVNSGNRTIAQTTTTAAPRRCIEAIIQDALREGPVLEVDRLLHRDHGIAVDAPDTQGIDREVTP